MTKAVMIMNNSQQKGYREGEKATKCGFSTIQAENPHEDETVDSRNIYFTITKMFKAHFFLVHDSHYTQCPDGYSKIRRLFANRQVFIQIILTF